MCLAGFIIGADLRRPKIYSDFNLNNKVVGQDKLIQKSVNLKEGTDGRMGKHLRSPARRRASESVL